MIFANLILYQKAGKGWAENGTYYIVKDPVTWYAATAADSFGCYFSKSSATRKMPLTHIAKNLYQNRSVNY